MSSAVSSLKGTKRTPLPPVRRAREVRSGPSLASLDHHDEEVRDPNALDFSTRSAVVDELRKCRRGGGSLPSLRKIPKPPGHKVAKPKSKSINNKRVIFGQAQVSSLEVSLRISEVVLYTSLCSRSSRHCPH